ncbi:MAG: hypothetical protein AAF957_26495 [Planctomycetota bacterium]
MRFSILWTPLALTAIASGQVTPFDEYGTLPSSRFGSNVSVVTRVPAFPGEQPEEMLAVASQFGASRIDIWKLDRVANQWNIERSFNPMHTNPPGSRFGASIALFAEESANGLEFFGVIGESRGAVGVDPTAGRAFRINASNSGGGTIFPSITGSGTDRLGKSAVLGDMNGDGALDAIIGSPNLGSASPSGSPGRVDVYDLSTNPTPLLIATIGGPTPSSEFGASVAFLGNGRFVVGAPNAGPLNDGAIYIYGGQPIQLETTITSVSTALGQTLGAMGDVNGDGVNDFYAGEPLAFPNGRIHVRSGVDGAILATISSTGGQGPSLGSKVAGGKDLDGDRIADLVVPSTSSSGLVTAYSGATGALIGTIPRAPSDTLPVSSLALIDAEGLYRNQVAIGQRDATSPIGDVSAGRVRILSVPIPFGNPYCSQLAGSESSVGGFPSVVASGSVSASTNGLILTTTGLPANSFATHYAGSQPDFFRLTLGGPSTRCFGGMNGAFGFVSTGPSGSITTAVDLDSVPGLGMVSAGSTIYLQCGYRDTTPTGFVFKMTSALEVLLTN